MMHRSVRDQLCPSFNRQNGPGRKKLIAFKILSGSIEGMGFDMTRQCDFVNKMNGLEFILNDIGLLLNET
jgi:hypothetical protein